MKEKGQLRKWRYYLPYTQVQKFGILEMPLGEKAKRRNSGSSFDIKLDEIHKGTNMEKAWWDRACCHVSEHSSN